MPEPQGPGPGEGELLGQAGLVQRFYDIRAVFAGAGIRLNEKIPFAAGEALQLSLDMLVELQWDFIVIAGDHDVARSVNFQDALGNHETQIFLLLNQLGILAGIHVQYQGIGFVQRIQGVFQFALLPEGLGNFAKIQGFIQVGLPTFVTGVVAFGLELAIVVRQIV